MAWDSMWDLFSLAHFYEQHAWAVDGILYLVLFMGIAQVTLGSTYKGHGGRAMVVAIGFALAVGASSLARRSDFTLASLGSLAWIMFLGVIGALLFRLLHSFGLPRIPSLAAAVLLMFGVANGIAPELEPWMAESGLMFPLQVAALASLVALVWWIASRFQSAQLGRPKNAPGANYLGRTRPDAQAERSRVNDFAATSQRGASVLDELLRLQVMVRRHGFSQITLQLLFDLKRRDRVAKTVYNTTVRQAARSGLQEQSSLPRRTKLALAATRDNLVEFDRVLNLAIRTHEQGDHREFASSLRKLIRLENDSLQYAAVLKRSGESTGRR